MTEFVEDNGLVKYAAVVAFLKREADSDCYIEIKYAGLTIHAYPSRLSRASEKKNRLKDISNFIVSLAYQVKAAPSSLAFECRHGDLSIGVMGRTAGWFYWLPARIVAFDPTQSGEPISASFRDGSGQVIAPPIDMLRKISL